MKTKKLISLSLFALLSCSAVGVVAQTTDGASCCIKSLDVTSGDTKLDEARLKMLIEELKWINLEAISLAIKDMSKIGSGDYDEAVAINNYYELEKLMKAGFRGIDENDPKAVRNAMQAVALKKTILFANPLLATDRIVAAKYNVGENSRKVNAGHLGTPVSNWTSQIDAPREGFDASIIEITNLKGSVKMEELYKPTNGSSIGDLRIHWDADKMLFTQAMSDKRWNVYELDLNDILKKQYCLSFHKRLRR